MKIYKQETKKSCGVACLRSILNHYGNKFSEEDVWKKSKPFKKEKAFRNPIISLGVTALKFGFKATYIGYNPIIANNNTSKNLQTALKKKSKEYKDYGKFLIDETLNFIKLKGKVQIEKPNIKTLKELIDKNKHLLVEVKPAFLSQNCSLQMNHKIILTGYNKKGFIALNPSTTRRVQIDFDTFLLAFYAAIPELLIIKN